MPARKWHRLEKISRDVYRLEPDEDPQVSSRTFRGVNFCKFAFDDAEERLVAMDTRGYVYRLELRGVDDVVYEKFRKLGLATCLAFNPLDRSDILVASATNNNISINRLDSEDSSLRTPRLSGHCYAVSHMSFHKSYCLSVSVKEAIIWDLRTYSKSHQLRLISSGANLKKSTFSTSGKIAALYSGDVLQIWPFESFDEESRVSLTDIGARDVKDFVFTRDSRAIVLCTARGEIFALDTMRFEVVVRINTREGSSVAKQLAVIPQPLDAGANKILAVHRANGSLRFYDLGMGKSIESRHTLWDGIRSFAVSDGGRWLACVELKGSLQLCCTDGMFLNEDSLVRKRNEPSKGRDAHRANEHLRSIENDVREELGVHRLLPILKEFGEYPGKHRVVIWKTVMKLPTNKNACAGLTEMVSGETLIGDMLEKYPLTDRSKASLLATTVERLVRWCPLLAQCQFLPALVFPFLVVFQKDRLLALEASITVLSNFCQKWFEYHPLPPLNVLGIVENVLLESDPTLLTCFCERGITSTDYAWPLLRTALSEVLAANEWLVLWDNLLTNQRPSLLIMCVVAYSICSRETIISFLRKPDDFRRFYASQGNVSIKELLRVARRLDSNTPERIHPNRYLRDDFVVLPNVGPYPPFLMHEYPRFLTDQQSDLVQLRALKEEEKILRDYRQRAIKIAEEKRLRSESDNFVKEIQRNRLMELRRCYEEQLRITRFNVENAREEIERCASIHGETVPSLMDRYRSVESEGAGESSGRSRSVVTGGRSRSDKCKELRNQVRELETEVQHFLGVLRTKPSVDFG